MDGSSDGTHQQEMGEESNNSNDEDDNSTSEQIPSEGDEDREGPALVGALPQVAISSQQSLQEGQEREADWSACEASTPDISLQNSENRLSDGQKIENMTATSDLAIQGSAESASVLHEMLETVKQAVKDIQEVRSTIASEVKQTNNLLWILIEEIKKLQPTHLTESRQNSHTVGPFSCTLDATNSSKILFNTKDQSGKESGNSTALKHGSVKDKEEMTLPERVDQIQLIKKIARGEHESLGPEHVKCVTDLLHQFIHDPINKPKPVPERSSHENQRGADPGHGRSNRPPAPDLTKQAQDASAEASAHGNRRPGASSQGPQHSKETRDRSQVHTHKEEERIKSPPSNILPSEDRPPSTSTRPPDARPKEPQSTPPSRHSQHRNRISAHVLTLSSHGGSESQRLSEALDRARAPDPDPPPKARSFDTVLCLDTSESMLQGNASEQMLRVVKDFIDGVEDMTSEVEENIALVTFGGETNIIQHLTNDFSLIRQALGRITFGGCSPFYEAMAVSLSALDGKGGTVSVSGAYDIHPRIIFITDGHITEGHGEGLDRVKDATNTRANFSCLMMNINSKKHSSLPHPVIFVPVGTNPDKKFLKSMADLSDGQLLDADNLTSICNYFKIQETIGKVIVCIHNMPTGDMSGQQIEAIILSLAPDISQQERAEVTACVQKEMENPNRPKGRIEPTDFDNVHEDKDGVELNERLPLGTRVVRGPDWQWDNQDMNGPGTVVLHEDKKHGFTWVLWDGGQYNRYPYGSELGYHIFKTTNHPVPRSSNGNLQIGMVVKKGSAWDNPKMPFDTEPGTVIRVSRHGKMVKVRWRNGEILPCPAKAVEYSDPLEERRGMDRLEEEDTQPFKPMFEEDEDENDSSKVPVWQWRDDWGNWRLYSRDEIQLLESVYKNKKTGTCLIQRGGQQIRVLFKRKTERDVDKQIERDIQRICISNEDLQSLECAEKLLSMS